MLYIIISWSALSCFLPNLVFGFPIYSIANIKVVTPYYIQPSVGSSLDGNILNSRFAGDWGDRAARLLAEEGNQWAGLFYQIAQINLTLDQILITVQTFATKEQVEGILDDLTKMGEGIDQLVSTADYDYDGVINALDKCPNTPIDEINNVNSDGCSPSQLTD